MSTTATAAVLFCDLVDSTARLTRLGDTAGDEFRHRFFGRLTAPCEETGGVVIKNLGDGLMVVFEHSTIDAIHCAAKMHESVAGLDPDDPARLRIGISVGEVSEDDGDWFGTPVVEAARLCSAAAPRQTLATAVVRTVIGSRADTHTFDPLGPMSLKGLAGPVDVVAVDSPRDAESPPLSTPSTTAAQPGDDHDHDHDDEDEAPLWRRLFPVAAAATVVIAVVPGGWWWLRSDDGGAVDSADAVDAPLGGATGEAITSPEGYTPEFESTDCPPEVTQATPAAQCGRLTVPEVRSDPDGPTIGVDVVRAAARSTPSAPPVLILDAGDQLETTSLRDVSDLYALSYRGLSPSDGDRLDCEEIRDSWTASFALRSDDLAGVQQRVRAAEQCAARLRDEGVRLEGYTMVEVANDLRDLTVALDLDSVSVAAGDVSSTAAMEFARTNPGRVSSLLLANPTPPGQSKVADPARNLWEAFDRLNGLCEADPDCLATFGDLEESFEQRFLDLESAPRQVETIPLGASGSAIDVLLDGKRLSAALHAALSSTPQLGYVPTAVATPVTAEQLVASAAIDEPYRLFVDPGVANAAVLSYVCSYDGSRPRSADLSNAALAPFGGADEPALADLCAAWNVPSIFDDVATPLSGNLPVFISQGGLAVAGVNDWAEMMERTLNNATVARFPTMSEDIVFAAPKCLRDLRREFLVAPSAIAGVEGCEEKTPPIEFVGAG